MRAHRDLIAIVSRDSFMQKIIDSIETNTNVIQSLYQGFASGNIEGVADLLTSDFIMHVPGKGRNAGEYWGREGSRKKLLIAAQRKHPL